MNLKPTLAAVADLTRRASAAEPAATTTTAQSLLDSISGHMDACEVAASPGAKGLHDADAFLHDRAPGLAFSPALCGLAPESSRAPAPAPPSNELSEKASDLIAALRAGRLQP